MQSVETYIKSCVRAGVFPGASWVIGNSKGNGLGHCPDILEQGATGVLGQSTAGVLGQGLGPVQQDSLYDLASLTKLFVTLALMRQMEDGLIRLEDTVDYFLPAYKNNPKGGISLFQLLTHTSCLSGGTQLYRHAHTREDLLEAIRCSRPRSDSPGRVVYTCEAFILLGEILPVIDGVGGMNCGLDPAQVIHRRVLEPLQMNDTCFNPPASLLERIAPTEDCPWRGKIVRGQVHDENAVVMGGVSGNAGLFSTAVDMARFAAAVLASLEGREEGFLHSITAEMMIHNHTAGKGENRGLGWMIAGPSRAAGDLMSPCSFGHTGFTGTSLWIDPENHLYAVLLSNRIHPSRDNGGIFRTRQIFHNLAVLQYGGRSADEQQKREHSND
ncbi:esterase [Spirochaetia bacterium]|nr:esterase [Spirochaetia bacterium]